MMRRAKSERGAALIEAAITIPLLLLISVGIFEFGRAWQTWQVLTNAAREGARLAVLPDPTAGGPEARAREYMMGGQLPKYNEAVVDVNRSASITVNGAAVSASEVTIEYPFTFVVLQPVARLVSPGTSVGGPLTIRAQAVMRNETASP
jgi:Flp pilus assembly protein TadG